MFRATLAKIANSIKKILILLLCGYQYLISPLLGNCCRFYPSCSAYAQQAIQHYGIFKGIWITLKRLAKCHPWHPGGFEPLIKQKR